MQIRIMVMINPDPREQSAGSYGNLQFQEEATFQGAGFETISKIFTKCHELLETLKIEHSNSTKGLRER